MAYTYDNILEEARKAGVLERFSQEDHNAAQKNPEYGMSLIGLLKDANNASTETQRLLATETVNQLRKSYGVAGATGSVTGSSFAGAQRLVAPEKTGTLAGSDPTTYQTVLDDIVNQKEFTYNHENDPAYESYAKAYLREGKRASENALAQAAAMSGGRPSSYALTVAQQVGNQYAAQLADMIPTLRQNAQAEHNNEIAAKYDILNALEAKQQTDYQKLLDDENRKRLERQDALTKYQVLGYATPDVAQILGVPEGAPKGTFSVTNETGTENGQTWYMVGSSKLTKEEIDKAITAGTISAAYDTQTGKVTYSWKEGMEPGSADEPIILNEQGGEGYAAWVKVGGRQITWTELNQLMNEGKIDAVYDPKRNAYAYQWVGQNATGGGGKLGQMMVRT